MVRSCLLRLTPLLLLGMCRRSIVNPVSSSSSQTRLSSFGLLTWLHACSTMACPSDGWLSAHALLALLGWTALPAAGSLFLRRAHALSVPVSPSVQHPTFLPRFRLSHRKFCDRRQLMSTKAQVSKKNRVDKKKVRRTITKGKVARCHLKGTKVSAPHIPCGWT